MKGEGGDGEGRDGVGGGSALKLCVSGDPECTKDAGRKVPAGVEVRVVVDVYESDFGGCVEGGHVDFGKDACAVVAEESDRVWGVECEDDIGVAVVVDVAEVHSVDGVAGCERDGDA